MLTIRQILSKIKDYKEVISIEKKKGNKKEEEIFKKRVEKLEKQIEKR